MKKHVLALVWAIGIGLPLVAIASGGYYLFHSENTKNAGVNATLSSISSATTQNLQAMQQKNLTVGQIFSEVSSAGAFIPEAYIQDAYTADNNVVVGKTDSLFKDPQTSDPKLNLKTDADIKTKIDTLRKDITDTLNAWKDLIRRIDTQGPEQGSPTIVDQYANTVKEYIDELKDVVDSLTPDNSGLTPQEIAADQAIVADAVRDADQAITIIETAPIIQPYVPNNPDPNNSNPQQNNPQQNPPDNGNSNTNPDTGGTGNTGGNTGGDSGTNTSPDQTGGQTSSSTNQNSPPDQTFNPPPQDNSGTPRLIEGANHF